VSARISVVFRAAQMFGTKLAQKNGTFFALFRKSHCCGGSQIEVT
jgi:hypothetical protein